MKQEKYFCDGCKKEFKESNELFDVEIKVRSDFFVRSKFDNLSKRFDLCLDCGQKLGLLVELPEEKQQEARASIEDRLYEIVEELVSDAMDNQ